MSPITRPIAGAIALVLRDRRVLLVQRRNPPDAGLWGYPGGKVEPGETIAEAAMRELLEETGVTGRPLRLLTPLDVLRHDPDGRLAAHFILLPVVCAWVSGVAAAASDALDAAWFAIDGLQRQGSVLCRHVPELAQRASAHEASSGWRSTLLDVE